MRHLKLDIRLPDAHADLLKRANLESASFAPFRLVWLSRPSRTMWRAWLALRADSQGTQQDGGDADGALLIRGADNVSEAF